MGSTSKIINLITIIGWVIIGIALFFGILGIIIDKSKGKAIAGFILGVFGLSIGILIRVVLG